MRYVIVILGLLLVLGTLGVVKFAQISSLIELGKKAEAAGPPPEAVGSAAAEVQVWEETLSAIGSVASRRGVVVTNEAPGAVTKIHFESGATVEKGQLLVELDVGVERAELASAEARRELASVSERRSRALVGPGIISRQEMDAAEAELEAAVKDVDALKAQIELKVVRAPFGGRLGIREIDLGQYLSAGSPITELETLGAVYVDFTLPQQHLTTVRTGMPIRATAAGLGAASEGTIAAVEPKVDEITRTFKARATLPNGQETLRPGMFVDVAVILPEHRSIVVIPATSVVHAPFGDSVFVIESKLPGSPGMDRTETGKPVRIARQRFVRLGSARGDFVAVSEGLESGAEVVSAGAFKLRNGTPIVIDNTANPKPEQNPRPENR